MSESTCGDRRGTHAGYNRHRRAGEDACPECLAGEAAYGHKRYERRVGRPVGQPKKVPHGSLTMYYSRGCRCEECRARMRAYSRERRTVAPGVPRTCEACGAEYEARKDSVRAGRAKYCSAHCRNVVASGEAVRSRKPSVRSRAERRAEDAAQGTRGKRVWIQGPCAVCCKPFLSPGASSRYCSRDCRAVANPGSKWINDADRLAIYREDDWTCQICEQETLRRFVHGNPLSPTLDHIVPRTKGGTNDRSNLRLLCFACNSLRGDLSFYSDEEVRSLRLAA